MTTEQCLWCPWRSLNKWDCNKQQFAQELLECPDRPKLLIAVGHFSHINFDHERYPDQSEYLDLSPIKRSVARCHELMNVWRYEEWAGNLRHHRANRTRSGTVPLRSHREVVGSFRNDRTQWNRCEHGRPVAFRNRSGPKRVV